MFIYCTMYSCSFCCMRTDLHVSDPPYVFLTVVFLLYCKPVSRWPYSVAEPILECATEHQDTAVSVGRKGKYSIIPVRGRLFTPKATTHVLYLITVEAYLCILSVYLETVHRTRSSRPASQCLPGRSLLL